MVKMKSLCEVALELRLYCYWYSSHSTPDKETAQSHTHVQTLCALVSQQHHIFHFTLQSLHTICYLCFHCCLLVVNSSQQSSCYGCLANTVKWLFGLVVQPRRLWCKTSITRWNSLGVWFALQSPLAFTSCVTGNKSAINQTKSLNWVKNDVELETVYHILWSTISNQWLCMY